MKELSLYKIRDLAFDSGQSVFSVQQLANLVGKPRNIAMVYSARLVEKGLAVRIKKGLISFETDEWIIASQLIEPSYVSLDSALFFHGWIQQVPKKIECVTTKNSFDFPRFGIEYHKISKKLFFGFKKHSKGKGFLFVAEPEKALLDGLYLNRYSQNFLKEFSEKTGFAGLEKELAGFSGRGSKKIKKILKEISHD